jgi:hypothetical protein
MHASGHVARLACSMIALALKLIGKPSPAWIVSFPSLEHHSAPLRLEAGGLLASPCTDPACSWKAQSMLA